MKTTNRYTEFHNLCTNNIVINLANEVLALVNNPSDISLSVVNGVLTNHKNGKVQTAQLVNLPKAFTADYTDNNTNKKRRVTFEFTKVSITNNKDKVFVIFTFDFEYINSKMLGLLFNYPDKHKCYLRFEIQIDSKPQISKPWFSAHNSSSNKKMFYFKKYAGLDHPHLDGLLLSNTRFVFGNTQNPNCEQNELNYHFVEKVSPTTSNVSPTKPTTSKPMDLTYLTAHNRHLFFSQWNERKWVPEHKSLGINKEYNLPELTGKTLSLSTDQGEFDIIILSGKIFLNTVYESFWVEKIQTLVLELSSNRMSNQCKITLTSREYLDSYTLQTDAGEAIEVKSNFLNKCGAEALEFQIGNICSSDKDDQRNRIIRPNFKEVECKIKPITNHIDKYKISIN
jgi:uncharacterized protein YejL (UPF0352 family)